MLQDLRYAWRSLTARPAFTLLATLTLAVGLGTSVAMYSVVRGVLFEPLPFSDSDSLLSLYRFETKDGPTVRMSFSLPDLRTGELVSADVYRGKPAVFYMWASW